MRITGSATSNTYIQGLTTGVFIFSGAYILDYNKKPEKEEYSTESSSIVDNQGFISVIINKLK